MNAAMGMFKVRVRVTNPSDASRFFEDEFWVDTGALYSFVPEDRLEGIGIDPALSRDVILADGRRERLRFGEARMTVEGLGETLTCPLVFGPIIKDRFTCSGPPHWKPSGSMLIPWPGG